MKQVDVGPGPTAPRWATAVATVLGAGRSRVAPGTVGAIVALPVALALTLTPLWVQLLVLACVTAVGTLAAERVRVALGTGDPQVVVIDEFAGILVTFLGAPATWLSAVLGLALFRFFDIAKPYPVGWLDANVPGGVGIMADDLVAGALACALLQLAVRLV